MTRLILIILYLQDPEEIKTGSKMGENFKKLKDEFIKNMSSLTNWQNN